ncbi:MAG: hypothetical protein ACTSQI_04200 [Candidatus Helarchaeota archaeon]
MDQSKATPQTKSLFITTIIAFIPFIIISLLFIMNELRLEATTGYGLLDLELAWTPNKINTIFTAWGPLEIQRQISMHYLDLVYAFCYGFFGAVCILLISRKLNDRFRTIGTYLSLSTVIAGIFDELENVNLLIMLRQASSPENIYPFLASIFSTLKIAFIGVGLCSLYILFAHWIVQEYKSLANHLNLLLIFGPFIIWMMAVWSIYIALQTSLIYLIVVLVIERIVRGSQSYVDNSK